LGPFDGHDPSYDTTARRIPFYSYTDESINDIPSHFSYHFDIYATSEFEASYETNTPIIAALVALFSFAAVIAAIFCYDLFVYQRDEKIRGAAVASGGIVSSMFPSHIRHIILAKDFTGGSEGRDSDTEWQTLPGSRGRSASAPVRLIDATDSRESSPIACLFPETTVLFSDIAGFTAWSSTRPPEEVFTLLESIFRAFDAIARRLGVYKVETIGDCYVAVTGLPDPQPKHATIMAQFARECLYGMKDLLFRLQRHLGAGTESLSTRFGLHSGPVTAGVLRGDRARFQLFGDTVHIASCMESTCRCDCIQVSLETAAALRADGHGSWLTPRCDVIREKGQENRPTYWVTPIQQDETEFVEFR
jgi:class 3 adenylate cyclase